MTILLDTPLDYPPGHGLPSEVLAEVQIVEFKVDVTGRAITIHVQYGNTVNDHWVPGSSPTYQIRLADEPEQINFATGEGSPANPAFSMIVGLTFVAADDVGERLYDVVARSLFKHLSDNEPGFAGTVQ